MNASPMEILFCMQQINISSFAGGSKHASLTGLDALLATLPHRAFKREL